MSLWRGPTAEEAEAIYAAAFKAGLDGEFTDSSHHTDWARLIDSFEGLGYSSDAVSRIDLGTDNESPVLRRIRTEYRRGLQEVSS